MMLSVAALCLLGAVLAPVAAAAESGYLPGKQVVIVFPVRNGIGEDKAQMADDLQVLLKESLSLIGRFSVMSCDMNSNVSLQRAVTEQKITPEDIKSGFSTDPQGVARAQKACQAIATDLGVISSLDKYSFDYATKEAKIEVTVQVVSGSPDAKPFAIAVTGIAAGKPDDQTQSESGIAIAALGDACDKILSEISTAINSAMLAEPVAQGQVSSPKSHKKGFLPAMLAALLLGLALGGK